MPVKTQSSQSTNTTHSSRDTPTKYKGHKVQIPLTKYKFHKVQISCGRRVTPPTKYKPQIRCFRHMANPRKYKLKPTATTTRTPFHYKVNRDIKRAKIVQQNKHTQYGPHNLPHMVLSTKQGPDNA